jgi:hypothetical protein
MMFQTFTTLAALLLFASNAALAAPYFKTASGPEGSIVELPAVEMRRDLIHPAAVGGLNPI